MKTIVYRGGLVTFRIPSNWSEEYSEYDGGMFYEAGRNSGTLRLTVVTFETPPQTEPEFAMKILNIVTKNLKQVFVNNKAKIRPDGNAVFRYEEDASERGQALKVIFWVIANPLPPSNARVITFSYTLLAAQRNMPKFESELVMLDNEIEAAVFAKQLGINAD